MSAQIALAIVLLVGAGLLIRTMGRLGQSTLGLDPDPILTLHISASWGETNNMRQVERRIFRTVEAMRAIPGVEDAAVTIALPGTGEEYLGEFSIVGHPPGPKPFTDIQSVSPEFFRVMRIPILAGETCRFSNDEKFARHNSGEPRLCRSVSRRGKPDRPPRQSSVPHGRDQGRDRRFQCQVVKNARSWTRIPK